MNYATKLNNRMACIGGPRSHTRSDVAAIGAEADAEIAGLRAALAGPEAQTEPDRWRAPLLGYVERYAPAGHFLMAVLRNDLGAAYLHGAHGDIAALPDILSWLYAHAPLKCWGSAHAVAAWVANYDDGLPF